MKTALCPAISRLTPRFDLMLSSHRETPAWPQHGCLTQENHPVSA
jgi:hypothetical protein